MAISLNKLNLALCVLQGFRHSEMTLWGQFCLRWSFLSGGLVRCWLAFSLGVSIYQLFYSYTVTIEWLSISWINWFQQDRINTNPELDPVMESLHHWRKPLRIESLGFFLHKMETGKRVIYNNSWSLYKMLLSMYEALRRIGMLLDLGEAEDEELDVEVWGAWVWLLRILDWGEACLWGPSSSADREMEAWVFLETRSYPGLHRGEQ